MTAIVVGGPAIARIQSGFAQDCRLYMPFPADKSLQPLCCLRIVICTGPFLWILVTALPCKRKMARKLATPKFFVASEHGLFLNSPQFACVTFQAWISLQH